MDLHDLQGPEPTDPFDQSCDLCGRIAWDRSLRPETHGGSTLWKCAACRQRDQERYERFVGSVEGAA